jgi:isochorismate pyruvate lyase
VKFKKSPAECENLQEIRHGIDCIDQQIIMLLRKRMNYVLSASRFKLNEASIPAPDRVAGMLVKRRLWAEQQQLPCDYIESLFSEIIQWFISQQTRYWRAKHGLSPDKV